MISRKMLILTLAIVAVIAGIYYSGLGSYCSLEQLKMHHETLHDFVNMHYITSVLIYIGVYAILIACALPVVAPLTLIGGFLYGFMALIYAEIACLLGCISSFLVLRYMLFHWIKYLHNERIDSFNEQIKKYGPSYLLMLQFLSVVPLFVINVLAAMANVSFKTVVWTTLVGSLPSMFLFVFAGKKLSTVHSISDIFSPSIIILLIALAALAMAPIFLRNTKKFFGA